MNELSKLEVSSRIDLERLRDAESGTRDLLIELITTSCLFEITKLIAARLDIASFVTATVDVLTQHAPIDNCAINIAAPDVPPVNVLVGDFPAEFASALPVDDEPRSVTIAALTSLEERVGYLAANGLPTPIAQSQFLIKAADQISSGLAALIEADRMRRQLADARARDVIASLDEGYNHEHLLKLVDALSMLPKAVGASLKLTNPRFGGPLHLSAGTVGVGHSQFVKATEVDQRTRFKLCVQWSTEPTPSDEASLTETLTSFATTLTRIERDVRLLEEVETDVLTGVGNRRRGLKTLSATRSWADREDGSFAVLLLDLDHFKRVNDTLGHDVGDQVLIASAKAIETMLRDYDTLVRWGGEEFLIVCPDTDVAQASAVARRVLALIPTACEEWVGAEWDQTVSIGIATFPDSGSNPTELVRAADTALYCAKNNGRNQYQAANQPVATAAPGSQGTRGEHRRHPVAGPPRRFCHRLRDARCARPFAQRRENVAVKAIAQRVDRRLQSLFVATKVLHSDRVHVGRPWRMACRRQRVERRGRAFGRLPGHHRPQVLLGLGHAESFEQIAPESLAGRGRAHVTEARRLDARRGRHGGRHAVEAALALEFREQAGEIGVRSAETRSVKAAH
jgi:diguanylate cyclase (GGDEF)-like protein